MTLLSGSQVGMGNALLRLLLTTVYLAIGLAALGAIGLFVSTLTEQPIAAMIAVVIIDVAMFIADSLPQLDWRHSCCSPIGGRHLETSSATPSPGRTRSAA